MSRISASSVGWWARNRLSVQPVHACPDSQNTVGCSGAVAASAIRTPSDGASPRVAATLVQ